MNIGLYAILILFGLFVVLLIVNPNLSCFGKRVRSPFYPLLRRRRPPTRKIPTTDFGFHLSPDGRPAARPAVQRTGSAPAGTKPAGASSEAPKTEDYGFHLD
jgi:hypothetical protein